MRSDRLHTAVASIRAADALVICAGAGFGVDSGLPDFRGDEGFWRAYPPIRRLGLSFVDMANPRWFRDDPHLAWGFYGHRLHLYRATQPHEGFAILRRIGQRLAGGAFVFTSNVDGQFQAAGFDEDAIFEVHGSIRHLQCSRPCTSAIDDADGLQVDVDSETFRARDPLPACPACGRVARPNVLMFGDGAWLGQRSDAQERRYAAWRDERRRRQQRVVVLEAGAGEHVPTVRHHAEAWLRSGQADLIRINPREAWGPRGTVSIEAGALEALTAIESLLLQEDS